MRIIEPRQQPNDDKMRELILHISRRSEGDETYGATKLNKLLFLADFLAYAVLGESITGHEYQALPMGPAPRYLVPIRDKMLADEEIAIRKVDFYGREQQRTFALREPDLSQFSALEIDLVDRLISTWWGRTAKEISDRSHNFAGWALADYGETIPYETALVGNREPTDDEIAYGETLRPLAMECLAQCYRDDSAL